MIIKKNTLLSAAVALALAACGGSSYTNGGTAIDGYLEGSTVTCLDGSGNTATTKANGTYSFATACNAPVSISGGSNHVSADVSYAFKGALKAPMGSSVVTPLTTLIPATPEGLAALKNSLRLGSSTDLTKVDPVSAAAKGDISLFKTTLTMQSLMQGMTDAFGGDYAVVAASASTSLANTAAAPLFLEGGTLDPAVLTSLVAAAGLAATGHAIDPALLASLVSDLEEQAEKFLQATSLDGLTNLAVQFQNPDAPAIDPTASTKFLALQDDSISFNKTKTKPGTTTTLAAFNAGTAQVSGLTTIDLEFDLSRMPVVDAPVGMFLELVEQGGQGRTLQLLIDKVAIKLDSTGQLNIDANGAKVYVYGKTGDGSEINMTLNDLTFNPVSGDSSVKNKASFNFDQIVNRVIQSANNTTSTTAAKFTSITGSFATKIIVSNVNIRHEDGSKFDLDTAVVNNSTATITGRSITGVLNVTAP